MSGVIYARVSNSVLDPEEWPVYRLTIRDGVVISVSGRGGPPDLSDASIEEVAQGSRFDSTGYHPEVYHELSRDQKVWADFVTPDTIKSWLH